jgi:hypothetical protein
MDWNALRSSTAKYFSDKSLVRGFGPDDILNLSADSGRLFLGPIDWSWGQSDSEVDQKLSNAQTKYLQYCNQVEILLSEAGTLIERSLGDLVQYDGLNVERFKLLMEFSESDRMYAQQQAEQVDADFWRGLATEQDLSSQARIVSSGNAPQMDQNYDQINGAYQGAQDILWNKGNDYDSARLPLAAQRVAMINARAQFDAQVAANRLDSDSRKARQKFETQSRIHQSARQQIARDIVMLKISEFQRTGGALNYNDRMLEIAKRAWNDFNEAFARLNAIALGLREFYSVTDPSGAELKSDLNNSRTRIEGAVTWLRKAANALARAKMDEQETVVRITLQEDPSTLFNKLKNGYSVTFPPSLVAKMHRPRLRSLSAVAGFDDDAWLDLEVTSPSETLHSAAITLPGITTRLGRANWYKSLNPRDVATTRPIINRSPVGEWTVRLLREWKGDSVSRVDLDFQLAFVRA